MIYKLVRVTLHSAAKAFFDFHCVGREKLVEEGGVLIASNHESYFDPPLISFIYRHPIHFLARKTLFRGPAAWLYPRLNAHPVDQENPEMASLKKIIRLLRGGERVLIFPEGARTEDGELQSAEPGTGLIVSKAKVRVQPVRIFGARNCLPKGSGRVRRSPITVVVGEVIEFSAEELDGKGKAAYQMISDRIMKEITALELPPGRSDQAYCDRSQLH